MSSKTTQSVNETSRIFSVSHSFALKWTLKSKKLKDLLSNSVVRSDVYKFKFHEDLYFFLALTEDDDDWSTSPELVIHIDGSNNWSFQIAYAFLVTKDRAFRLEYSPQLSFLDSFSRSDIMDEEEITIHCLVNASPAYPVPSTKEDGINLQENQNVTEYKGNPILDLPSSYTNKLVINFLLNGVLPDLDIESAIKIIAETTDHKCEVLKILCVAYLMSSISNESIRKISNAAINLGLPILERECLKKIANGSIAIK